MSRCHAVACSHCRLRRRTVLVTAGQECQLFDITVDRTRYSGLLPMWLCCDMSVVIRMQRRRRSGGCHPRTSSSNAARCVATYGAMVWLPGRSSRWAPHRSRMVWQWRWRVESNALCSEHCRHSAPAAGRWAAATARSRTRGALRHVYSLLGRQPGGATGEGGSHHPQLFTSTDIRRD